MVSKEQIREQIEALRSNLNYHNHKYYVDNAPEISDFEFDTLMRQLVDLEAAHPEFNDPLSPSVREISIMPRAKAETKRRTAMSRIS